MKPQTEIEVWESFKEQQRKLLNEAIKYGDYGSEVSAEEMIRYSQKRIDELEMKLARKGA